MAASINIMVKCDYTMSYVPAVGGKRRRRTRGEGGWSWRERRVREGGKGRGREG